MFRELGRLPPLPPPPPMPVSQATPSPPSSHPSPFLCHPPPPGPWCSAELGTESNPCLSVGPLAVCEGRVIDSGLSRHAGLLKKEAHFSGTQSSPPHTHTHTHCPPPPPSPASASSGQTLHGFQCSDQLCLSALVINSQSWQHYTEEM